MFQTYSNNGWRDSLSDTLGEARHSLLVSEAIVSLLRPNGFRAEFGSKFSSKAQGVLLEPCLKCLMRWQNAHQNVSQACENKDCMRERPKKHEYSRVACLPKIGIQSLS